MIQNGSFYVSHPRPIEKTPLVGVFFIGAEGKPLEVSASRKKGRLETPTGRLAPERSEEVQYLSISRQKSTDFGTPAQKQAK